MTLASKIVDMRKQSGMTQEQLAADLGVSRQTVSKWELGTAMPDTVHIIALSKLFDVTTDYLLTAALHRSKNICPNIPVPFQRSKRYFWKKVICLDILYFGESSAVFSAPLLLLGSIWKPFLSSVFQYSNFPSKRFYFPLQQQQQPFYVRFEQCSFYF